MIVVFSDMGKHGQRGIACLERQIVNKANWMVEHTLQKAKSFLFGICKSHREGRRVLFALIGYIFIHFGQLLLYIER